MGYSRDLVLHFQKIGGITRQDKTEEVNNDTAVAETYELQANP